MPVNHPEVIAHQAGARTAVVMQGDSFEIIDLPLVVSPTTRPAPTEAAPGRPA